MATSTAEQAAILRDAPLRSGAPQDEVRIVVALLVLRWHGMSAKRGRSIPSSMMHVVHVVCRRRRRADAFNGEINLNLTGLLERQRPLERLALFDRLLEP